MPQITQPPFPQVTTASAAAVLVQAQAGSQAQPALSQIDMLDRAVKDDPPDVTAIVRVRDWFGRHLPLILPAVLDVLAHPTIDMAIQAAGQVAQSEAARRSEP